VAERITVEELRLQAETLFEMVGARDARARPLALPAGRNGRAPPLALRTCRLCKRTLLHAPDACHFVLPPLAPLSRLRVRASTQPIKQLRNVNGAEISRPESELVRHHLHPLDDDRTLAFFQAVPASDSSPLTFLQSIWDDYLHGG
jgi:hypothetical protein